ncbi:regulator of protease activity HflC (stomatin/prohibitin superfamily) [Luteibacter sp. Sphag1AF]|uniref:prohibitin family protein n=1 Tax=Luteibacter sp. Sphag1AF TaxID=2587031 RepID=UPI0016118584|nr:prohibitin family protein [Luteibacter sp. Sphag1AF]MBB3229068.1 regulator of protease activity HflC (stomatin/prohibitin superfamily) [Luteibacter sp. Sphag1AF]
MKRITQWIGLLAIMMLAACSKVPAGNVGIKFNLYGSDKGVQLQELPPGRYWIGWNEELYTFPTYTQTKVWSREQREDESLTFGTIEGLTVNADVGITYHVDPSKVTKLFQTYRKGVDEITDLYLRNMVRDALVRQASNMGVESVYGKGKAQLIQSVEEEVRKEVAGIGLVVEKVYWVGKLNLPENVVNSINAKIQATQMAEQRKNEVAQAQAEAQKVEAEAQGQANARLALAEAEAKAISLRGEALRNNPGVAELNAIEKWDGKLPVYQLAGSTPFLNLPASK